VRNFSLAKGRQMAGKYPLDCRHSGVLDFKLFLLFHGRFDAKVGFKTPKD
jgi:hypothetical protein